MGVLDPFALSPELIMQVAGILHKANYRTAMAHVHQAVIIFKERGGTPSPALTRAVQRAGRACARGSGPARHTLPFPVEDLARLPNGPEPWAKDGPSHPRRTLLLGCWWLIKEIELSNRLIKDVSFSGSGHASWNLSASKSDPRALGATRTHQCACGQTANAPGAIGTNMCPHCCLKEQADFATSLAKGDSLSPLFPTPRGACPTKFSMIETIRAAASKLGKPMLSRSGAPAWGGHALRRGGVQYLAARGIDVRRIQALARHSSGAILSYSDGVHAKNLGNIAAEAERNRSLQIVQAELRELQRAASPRSPSFSAQTKAEVSRMLQGAHRINSGRNRTRRSDRSRQNHIRS